MGCNLSDINDLPSIDKVKKISQGMALADAIFMPEWQYRYFSFNANWCSDGREMMASMRDGCGGEYFLHFTDQGVVGKVFEGVQLKNVLAHLKNIPDGFSDFKTEPSFSIQNSTYFFWRLYGDKMWSSLSDGLKAYPLIGCLGDGWRGYLDWAESYYEIKINAGVLRNIFESLSVTRSQLAILNPELTVEALEDDLCEIIGR